MLPTPPCARGEASELNVKFVPSIAVVKALADTLTLLIGDIMAFQDDVTAAIAAEKMQFENYKLQATAELQQERDQVANDQLAIQTAAQKIADLTAQLKDALTPEQQAAVLAGIKDIIPDAP